jgi:hypothetical protein
MSNQWFRFYTEVLNDEKVQSLNSATFKNWINLLCFCAKFGGNLPQIDAISFALRIKKTQTKALIKELKEYGLIDEIEGVTNGYKIHSWDKRQYKSDTSKDRMKRHRDKKCDVTVTPPDNRIQNTDINNNTTIGKSPIQNHAVLSDFFKKCNEYILGKFPDMITRDKSPIIQWEAMHADFDRHVKPTIDTVHMQGKIPSTLSYFTPIIKQFMDGLQHEKTSYSSPEEIFKRLNQG